MRVQAHSSRGNDRGEKSDVMLHKRIESNQEKSNRTKKNGIKKKKEIMIAGEYHSYRIVFDSENEKQNKYIYFFFLFYFSLM